MIRKKAQYNLGHYFLYFAIVAIFIAIIFVSVKSLIVKEDFFEVIKNKIAIENMILENKLINKCFVLEDNEINRIYLGILDEAKFTNDNLNKCTDRKVRLTLTNFGKNEKKVIGKIMNADFINQKIVLIGNGKNKGLLVIEAQNV